MYHAESDSGNPVFPHDADVRCSPNRSHQMIDSAIPPLFTKVFRDQPAVAEMRLILAAEQAAAGDD